MTSHRPLRSLLLLLNVLALVGVVGCGDDTSPDTGPSDAATDTGDLPMDSGDLPMDSGDLPMDSTTPDADVDAGDAGSDAEMDSTVVPACDDGIWNGDETDIDCGGPTCPNACGDALMCGVNLDCTSSVCIGGSCIAASCTDGIANGDESDRDCGGATCAGCPNGRMCTGMDDCLDVDSLCTGGYCQPGSCANMLMDGTETAVDCGGGTCAPCSDGDTCALPRDCASGICGATGVCVPAACTNGMMDGTEIGVDCGGDCPGCSDGTACTAPVDCLSGRCEGSVCTSCSDGVQSGAETDIDCGGVVCGGCAAGESCVVDEDCSFGDCLAGSVCDGPAEFYSEDFEGGDGGWTTGGTSSSWEYGTPANTVLDAAHSGTGAWVTNLTGDYNASEDSFITSPVIDLSAASEDPAFIFALEYVTEAYYDEGWVEVTTDGTTWTRLGSFGGGTNWYSNSSDEWDGASTGWIVASHLLTGTAGEATVQVRMVFSSDSSGQREGFAIDDVVIRAPIPNLTVTVEAVPDICGGAVVTLANTGETIVASADFTYGVDGSSSTETFIDMAPGSVETRTLFGDDGSVISASVSGALDANPTDDAASATLVLNTVLVGTASPYVEDFEASNGGWAPGGVNSTWEWGVPTNTEISDADSGTFAWVTDLDGDYRTGEASLLVSPCIDASASTSDLVFGFALTYESESCCDELTVDYSVDGGRNWDRVTAGMNWYSTSDGWAGSSGGWGMVSASLPSTAGKPGVRVRLHVDSDSSITDEGFGFDTVEISAGGMPDLQVTMERTASCASANAIVENVGTATVGAYALTLSSDGVDTRRTIIDPIAPGATATYPVTAIGTAAARVEVPGDVDASNDSDSIMLSIPLTGGYAQDFDTDDGGFTAGGTNSSWELGAPSGTFISGPASGVNAWVTGLSTDYNASEFSTLTSPCFDFSALAVDPSISFAHIYETEACCDHGWVEVSTDGGSSWNKLGRAGGGTNWYDDTILDWWNGASGAPAAWRTASHPMDGTAGATHVRFRFVTFTDGAVEAEGFGVDDIVITP
ncbi:MAG: hypothetical protein DRJ42_19870 [Deltaproteobacteria bacterium]|nr:MAG: hypothetical protein DRJ42_19870 [Deltaproteobacteria bacterium]